MDKPLRQFLANTGKAPSTVRSLAALLSSISLAAVEDEKIRKTFMPSRLALPPERVQERVFLSVAQVAELVEAADDRNKALIHTAAWTGLRWGNWSGSSGNDWTSKEVPSRSAKPWWTSLEN